MLFSYRAEKGRTGRMMACAGIKGAGVENARGSARKKPRLREK
jgi:hypothetical protein